MAQGLLLSVWRAACKQVEAYEKELVAGCSAAKMGVFDVLGALSVSACSSAGQPATTLHLGVEK